MLNGGEQWGVCYNTDLGYVERGRNLGRAEVNISPYPGTEVPGLFSFSRAVLFKSGGLCRNIGQEQLRVTHT